MGLDDGEIGWFQPLKRAIIPIGGFAVSTSLRRSARKYEVRFGVDYEEIMRRCADRAEGSWISEEIVEAYCEMHALGRGDCAGAYWDDELVGGVYGIRLGNAFMAESMFHSMTDAGKVALWKLFEKLAASGVSLFDVQYMSPHLSTLGAIEVSHSFYMKELAKALRTV